MVIGLSPFSMYTEEEIHSLSFFVDEAGAPPQALRLAVLGVPLPSLSYSIKF